MELLLAFDRSMRRKDGDGHLHVEWSNVSKANVCPYYGREIPNGGELGLDPSRVYMLYRDPAELQAAAHTMAGKPLLMHHKPITSDDHPADLVVGSVGTHTEWQHPYLRAGLSIWRQDAIDAVEAHPDDPDYQGELSPGYRYRADMTPGVSPEGVAFDGRMRDIKFNHLCIVKEGRTGHDVIVADEAPKEFPLMRTKFVELMAGLFPSLKATDAIALDNALAQDAFKTNPVEDEFPDMSAEDKKSAMDKFCAKTGKAMDAMSDEDKREAFKAAKDAKADEKPAMDAKTVQLAIDAAVAEAVKDKVSKVDADKMAQDAAAAARVDVHGLYAARKAVETTVGIVALDSAEQVYRFALDHLKVDHKAVDAGALAALYDTSVAAASAPTIATDAVTAFDPSTLWTFKG